MTRRTCPVCRHPFTASRADAITCSDDCRSRYRMVPEVRAVAIRHVKHALTVLAETTVGMPDEDWAALMDDIGQYLVAEVERITQEVFTDG